MSTRHRSILREGIDDRYLVNYLEGRLHVEEQRRLEALMDQDPFLKDAIDGLAEMPDKSQIMAVALQLNAQLKKQTQRKKGRAAVFTHQRLLIWVSVLMVILFVFLAWWLLRVMTGT